VTRLWPAVSRERLAADFAAVAEYRPAFGALNERQLECEKPRTASGRQERVWRLCKTYGRLIGHPMLKPHELRHGVAMEVYEQHGDLDQVGGLLGHARIETTQLYAQIRPAALKQAVEFYEAMVLDVLSS